ncbi:MAG: S1/P1 nuclease [Pseudomonas sp.]
MNKLLASVSLCAIALFLHAPDAAAWGAQGHRLVARIADTELTPQAHAEVTRLLAGEPDPTLAGVATWADELRQSDPDLGKRSARWHYVNLGEHDCRYLPARDCPDGACVVEALKTQAALLADHNQPLAVRRQALKFVVHLVGDIHQPMHAGYARDKGGNDFQLQFDGKGSNLHALWDSGMLRGRRLDDDAYLGQLLALPRPARDRGTALPPSSAAWAEASCRIAVTPGVYPARHVLPDDYSATWRPLAETQLRLAGERLAAILNAALDAP